MRKDSSCCATTNSRQFVLFVMKTTCLAAIARPDHSNSPASMRDVSKNDLPMSVSARSFQLRCVVLPGNALQDTFTEQGTVLDIVRVRDRFVGLLLEFVGKLYFQS